MLPFSDSLKWLVGETQGNDSTETGSCSVKTWAWIRDALAGSKKISGFYMGGYFAPFRLQERRKWCNCTHTIKIEKCCGRERECHGRRRKVGKMLD